MCHAGAVASSVVTSLDPLLALQERDLALDRLRHRRESLSERTVVTTADARVVELEAALGEVRAGREVTAKEEQRFDDEAQALAAQAADAERRLYSGEVSSPRELQALQADVDQLRRHQRTVEDRQFAAMERREPLDERIAVLDAELDAARAGVAGARGALEAAEGEIDQEAAGERAAREEVASGLVDDLVALYERCRAKGNGVGAARLVGSTCQGCHLSIPSTEVERIKKALPGTVGHCDNCGCILVP